MMRTISLGVLVLALGGGLALAQPAPGANAQTVAEQEFLAGNTAYNLGRFDEAVTHFTKAYEAWPQPEFLYNIAQSYRLAGNCKQALYFYKRFRSLKEKDTAAPLSSSKKEEVDRFVAQQSECVAKVDTGAAAQPQTLDRPGSTSTTSPAPAQLENPDEDAQLDDEEDELAVRSSSGRQLKIAGLATAGGGVALVVTGAVFGVMARSAQSDVEAAVDNGQPFDPDLDAAGRRNATISAITLGVGAAAVVTGGVLYFLGTRSSATPTEEARVRVLPSITSRTAGLTLDLRY